MKKFEFEISVSAKDQIEAEQKMKSLMVILNTLSTEELLKVAAVVKNPVQLALIKAKLL